VFATYPDHFEAWTLRLLGAMLDGAPLNRVPAGPPPSLRESLEWHAQTLLVATWATVRIDDPHAPGFLRALRHALTRGARALGARIDPLMGAASRYERLRVHIGAATEPSMPVGLLAVMPITDVMRLVGVDPSEPADHRPPTAPLAGPSTHAANLIARINEQSGFNARQRRGGGR